MRRPTPSSFVVPSLNWPALERSSFLMSLYSISFLSKSTLKSEFSIISSIERGVSFFHVSRDFCDLSLFNIGDELKSDSIFYRNALDGSDATFLSPLDEEVVFVSNYCFCLTVERSESSRLIGGPKLSSQYSISMSIFDFISAVTSVGMYCRPLLKYVIM